MNSVNYKELPTIRGRLYVQSYGNFNIGINVKINSGRNFNIIGGDIRTNFIIERGASLTIGNNVGLSNSTFVCSKSIHIGDNVLIGGSCKFYDTDFHSLNFEDRMKPYLLGQKDNGIKNNSINIGEGAWIGGHCIILKGVTIGEKAIVGAGSVVTKNVPSHEVWGGNPARFIRSINE
jgi:acetyltransferase-like isoleucine patch superfamily enzyme